MAVFALVHAAAVDAWYWHLLSAELRARGHDVVAADLPVDDAAAGLPEYAATGSCRWSSCVASPGTVSAPSRT